MIEEQLKSGYTYLVYDESIDDEPIEALCMEIGSTGDYNSFNSLHTEFGSLFVPTPFFKEGFKVIHLSLGLGSFDDDTDLSEFMKAMEKLLETDMRKGIRDPNLVDYENVPMLSYGFFSAWEIKSVPNLFEGGGG